MFFIRQDLFQGKGVIWYWMAKKSKITQLAHLSYLGHAGRNGRENGASAILDFILFLWLVTCLDSHEL